MKKLSGVFLLTFLAAACSFAPRDTGSSFMFALQPASTASRTAVAETLVVHAPTTSPELDTARIALQRDGTRWDYYAGARWADFLPMVVQDNVTKTIDQAHLYKSVATEGSGLTGDRILKTEIKAFQAEYAGGAVSPVVKIRMTMSIVSRVERRPLASFTVEAQKKASGNHLTAIQAAFAGAFDDAEKQLVDKLAEKREETKTPPVNPSLPATPPLASPAP